MARAKKTADAAKPAGGKGASELLKQAKRDYKIAEDWWADNRKLWLDDAKFREVGKGNQWPEKIRSDREKVGLPCIEADKTNQYVRQVVNDGRQNRPAVKVRPVDDRGDIQVADALQGLVRHICVRSNADEAFDTALDHAAGCGFGFFRVLTEYASEKTFNQELVVRRVPNPLAVLISPHELADGSDTRFGFVVDDVPKDEFESKYPKAKITDWKNDAFKEWSDDKTVKVCEYWYKVDVSVDLHLLEDGTTATEDEYELKLGALIPGEAPPKIMDTRSIPTCKVKWCRMTGAEILEERDWLGKYIPLVPVFGNESNIQGKVTYSGLLRAAKDPQRLHNYSRSAFAQRVALTTKAPWLAAAEQIADFPEWATAHSGTHAVLRYKHLSEDGSVIPPPIRISPSDVPAGFAQDAQMAEHDIQASMGMYANTTLGVGAAQSGKQELLQQKRGDTSTFHYQDNLNRAIRYLGRILVDAAPKYYDTKRVIRILGEDGTPSMKSIDPDQPQAVKKLGAETIYNIGVGEYDVAIEAGPSYITRRQESAQAMMEMTQANPSMWQTHGDLIVKAQDWPNADEFAKRSKMTLPPPIKQQVDAEEQDGNEDPALAELRAKAQGMIDDLHGKLQQAVGDFQSLQQENAKLKEQHDIKAGDVNVKAYQAETDRMTALAPVLTPESIAAIVQQTVGAIMAQPVPQNEPQAIGASPPMQPPNPPPMMAPAQDQPPPGGFFTPGGQ